MPGRNDKLNIRVNLSAVVFLNGSRNRWHGIICFISNLYWFEQLSCIGPLFYQLLLALITSRWWWVNCPLCCRDRDLWGLRLALDARRGCYQQEPGCAINLFLCSGERHFSAALSLVLCIIYFLMLLDYGTSEILSGSKASKSLWFV